MGAVMRRQSLLAAGVLALWLCCGAAYAANTVSGGPSVVLRNAAAPGSRMPHVGLGTGGYGLKNGSGGEYWSNAVAHRAVLAWLELGGRRIDSANDYGTSKGVGEAIRQSGIPRGHIFLTAKVGPYLPLGYNETLQQFDEELQVLGLEYVDLLLIHWPGPDFANPPEWPCFARGGNTTYKLCRQESWLALEKIFDSGRARAIGVANYEANHLQEILDLGGRLPSVNQCEHHPYWHEPDLVAFCQAHNITFNAYAPLGTPDRMAQFPQQWPVLPIAQANVTFLAQKYRRTPAQIILNWDFSKGIVTNPRSKNPEHMLENLNYFDFALSPEDIKLVDSIPKPSTTPALNKVCPDPHTIL